MMELPTIIRHNFRQHMTYVDGYAHILNVMMSDSATIATDAAYQNTYQVNDGARSSSGLAFDEL